MLQRSQLKDFFKVSLEAQAEEEKKKADEAEEEGSEIETETEEESGVESMEFAVLEVEEAGREIEEVEDDIEELEEVEEGLESICLSLEDSLEAGGLDPVAAHFAHHAVDAYTVRLGVESSDIIPSLESFGGESSRVATTQVSIEGIKEVLAQVWNAIKMAIEKAIKFTTDFFAKVFGGADKILKRVTALEGKLAAIKKSGHKADGKVKVGNADTLKFNNSVSVNDIETGLKNLVTSGAVVNGAYTDNVITFMDSSVGFIDKLTKLDADSTEKDAESVIAEHVASYEKLTAPLKDLDKNPMSGDKVVDVTEDGVVSIKASKESKPAGDSEIDALKPEEMAKILSEVTAVVKGIQSKKAQIEKVIKARKDTVAKVSGLVSKVNPGVNKSASKLIKDLQKDVTGLITSYSGLAFSVSRSAIALVETSMSKYKAEDDKKEPEAEAE